MYKVMIKNTILLIITAILFSCTNSFEINGIQFKAKSGTEYSVVDDIYHFFPEENYIYSIFGFDATLDSNYEHQVDSNGILINGRLGNELLVSNSKVEIHIPAESEIQYRNEVGDYLFILGDNLGLVNSDLVEYKIYEFMLFNEDHTFQSAVKETVEFKWNDEPIIFLRNDTPVWSDDEEFDYNYYSEEYRNRIEYDILKQMNIISIDTFQSYLEPPEGPGMHNFMGQWYEMKIDTKDVLLTIQDIEDEQIITRCFSAMNVGRPYVNSYEHNLLIPLEINQFGNIKDGIVELIIPVDEKENIETIINNKEVLYILFRMGLFSDFSVDGFGIIYFSYNDEQRNTLMNAYND